MSVAVDLLHLPSKLCTLRVSKAVLIVWCPGYTTDTMEYFSIIKDADIFTGQVVEPKDWSIRKTSKGFVYDDNGNICILEVRFLFGLPGGGVERGETFEEAFIRECMEEIGCNIKIDKNLGIWSQYRSKLAKVYEINYFSAHLVGAKGKPTTTEEDEKTVPFSWYLESEVLKKLTEQVALIPKEDYPMQFNSRTHLAAFKKLLESK